jgi:hypothetical protein
MSSIRKPCTNYPNATYTGKEQSPLRFGLSAEGYARYTSMEGFDKLMWIVDIKNNKKVWIRKTTDNKLTHEEPIINSNIDINITLNTTTDNIQLQNNTIQQLNNDTVQQEQNNSNKKITDYNIFLSYKLKLLKDEYKNSNIENKELFKKAMDEWKRIKNNQVELKEFIAKAKQDVSFNTVDSSKKKKNTNSPVILKDKVVEKDSNINNYTETNKEVDIKQDTNDIVDIKPDDKLSVVKEKKSKSTKKKVVKIMDIKEEINSIVSETLEEELEKKEEIKPVETKIKKSNVKKTKLTTTEKVQNENNSKKEDDIKLDTTDDNVVKDIPKVKKSRGWNCLKI